MSGVIAFGTSLATAAIALLILAGCGKSEISPCDLEDVLNVITRGTANGLVNTDKDASAELSGRPHREAKDSLFADIRTIKSSVRNIRQTRYDKENDTRYCAAELEYTQDPYVKFPILKYVLRKNTICEKNFTYKIEKTLDKQSDFYVTWRCSQ